jgi:hypothetical protein
MTEHTTKPPKIEMRLEGPAVAGRISVDMLSTVAKELQTSLRRMLASHRRVAGRFPTGVEQTCALELVAFAEGSAVLTFEYAGQRDRDTLHGDPGVRVAEDMLDAMQKAESGEVGWDAGLQAGVVDGWETLAKPLGEGVDAIQLTLLAGGRQQTARLTMAFRQNLHATSVAQPQIVTSEVVGVLWECDWKQHRGMLAEPDGNRVELILDEKLEERVTQLRRQRVRVRGRLERLKGRVTRAFVTSVDLLADHVAEPDPRYGGFWEKLSLDEMAARQAVVPVNDLDALAIDWPEGDSVDDFLDTIRGMRGR